MYHISTSPPSFRIPLGPFWLSTMLFQWALSFRDSAGVGWPQTSTATARNSSGSRSCHILGLFFVFALRVSVNALAPLRSLAPCHRWPAYMPFDDCHLVSGIQVHVHANNSRQQGWRCSLTTGPASSPLTRLRRRTQVQSLQRG